MTKYYSIDEVSKMFNIPKSTLRYWEDQKLIKIKRNDNSYRCYTRDNILQICSICIYRNLDLSINELKTLHKMNLLEIKELLTRNEVLVKNKISELSNTLDNVQNKLRNIEEVNHLSNHSYATSKPPFNKIINFHPSNKEYIDNYLKKQNDVAFVMMPDMKEITEYGIIDIDECDTHKVLWESTDISSDYVECILRVNEDNIIDESLLKQHLDYIKTLGRKPNQIIAQYMIYSYDIEAYDYYKIWIELI